MATSAQWTDLENFRQLQQGYEQRMAEYTKRLEAFRAGQAAGQEDPDLKAQLEREFAELSELYGRISDMRKSLAQARDSA